MLEQVVQRGCGISVFGDNQKASGVVLEIPLQLSLLDRMNSRGPCQTQLFCDCVVENLEKSVQDVE